METRASYLAVGGFLLALFAGLIIFVMWFSHVDFTKERHNYMIYFNGSVSGLRVNESVRFHGLPVGKVKAIYVDPKDVSRIAVKISVDNPALIRQDAVAAVEAQGLTGYSYVQINGGSQTLPPLKAKPGEKYPVIASRASGIEMLFSELPHILENVYAVTGKLKVLLDDKNLEAFSKTLQDISRISKDLAKGPNNVDGFMREARGAFAQINKTLKSMEGQIQGLQPAIVAVDKAATSLERLVDENRAGVRDFTDGGLSSVTDVMHEASKSLQTLNGILQQIEISPGRFLHESTDKGYQLP
ncbi:MAG: hypothetical protein C0514_02955 [Candidatus Puniceispirillum sp.]|nr:hypothetical protein [Candidatus Puniceispirillum sp.]